MDESPFHKLKQWQWWFLVAINIFFLIVGQVAALLLGRFYYDQGGNSKWMTSLVQTAGFPILFIPLFLFRRPSSEASSISPSIKTLALLYTVLGVIVAGEIFLYSVGLVYLSALTYSLICVTQLASNVVFSYFLNAQKFTALILNYVAILSLSAALIVVSDDSSGPSGVSEGKFLVGFLCTLGASALYSFFSRMQLSFQKVLKKKMFSVVLEMKIYTSVVASCVLTIGLFASGEWKSLHLEMEGFDAGRGSYVLTLVWTVVTWQVYSVGVMGLIFMVTSLFSNVISTLPLTVTHLAFLVVFYNEMNCVKIIAMLLALCGFASYIYQNYLDHTKATRSQTHVQENNHHNTSC